MPEVAALPDEQAQVQDFLEQQRLLEEERLRREEAARLLAEQDALAAQAIIPQGGNFMSQPTAEIDALQAQFNAPPPMPRQMIGDEQYQQEVARAQRGSGFVNADVSPTGDVIVPGYDPLKDFAALKAQQEATNLQRNQYVDSLVQGGATYAEAYRAGQGRYPQARNDAMRLKIEQLAQRQNTSLMQPEVVTINGVRALRTGPRSFSRIPEPTMVKGEIPSNVKTEQVRLFKEADRFKTLLDRGTEEIWSEAEGKTIKTPLSGRRKLELQQAIDASELKARDLVAPGGRLRPEFNRAVDQVGYGQMRQAWENPVSSRAPIPVAPTAPVAETITITTKEQFEKLPSGSVYTGKDGKKYRKP